MSRAPLTIAFLALQLACAGRVEPSLGLSSQPRGTDLSLLPSFVVPLEERAGVSVQLTRPAYLTVFEHTRRGDSLRVVFATVTDSGVPLDGNVAIRLDAVTRTIPGTLAQVGSPTRSCVSVPLGAGEPAGVEVCSTNTPSRASSSAARWRFLRPLVLLATEEPYSTPGVISIEWFRRVDAAPPSVKGAWVAAPIGMPVAADQGVREFGTSRGLRNPYSGRRRD